MASRLPKNLAVHLGQPFVSASFCCCDQLQCLLALGPMLRQEFLGGEEHGGASQAGVGVWAALLDGQTAVAVG